MGNSESSSSQFPSLDNDGEEEAPSSSLDTAIKAGAAVAGTALLAVGAWSLASSSGSGDPHGRNVTMESQPEGSGSRRGGSGRYVRSHPVNTFESSDSESKDEAVAWPPPDRGQLLDGNRRFASSSFAGEPHVREVTLEGLEISSRRVGGGGYFHQSPRDPMRHSSQLGDTKVKLSARLIKILSYNVWFREDVEVVERMKAIGRIIEQVSPDVIFFQEVTPNIYNIFRYSDWWGEYSCSVSPEKAATRKYFCILLSKLPVKEFSCTRFEGSTMGRELCLAEIDVGMGKKLVAATTHLESPTAPLMQSSERVAQARKALSLLRNPTNVVFGGDMNWDESTDGSFPLPDGWVDAWTDLRPRENGWTYDTKCNRMLSCNRPLQKRLDRFICKLKDFKQVSVDMIGTEAIPGLSYYNKKRLLPVFPSDHYGLFLTISSRSSESHPEAMSTLTPESSSATFTWIPPQPGQLKVNFDGSVKNGKASAGFVIRDASCEAILAGNVAFFALCSPPEAELRAAWLGLRAAIQRLHATSIWLEGDSQAAISWINDDAGELSKAPPYSELHGIWSWKGTLDSFKATHVFREANSPADWLAGQAVSTSLQIWSRDFPADLLSRLSDDAKGRAYTRSR